MSKEFAELVDSLKGMEYRLYGGLIKALGTPTLRQFLTWWKIISPDSRRRVKQVWKQACQAGGHSAYAMYLSLSKQGAIPPSQFRRWWSILSYRQQLRVKLTWWAFLQEGCHNVQITKIGSETAIAIKLTPGHDSPFFVF
ncbi:MAG: hypothetical protein Q8P73_03330 [bacterium]|nr:hypothetical protein [bacterium]MDZ4345234.1 hypothetical protein [Candidatus Binatia bacterium]